MTIETDHIPVRLLKIEEAAHSLAISESKLLDLVNAGEIRDVRIGRSRRIPVRELDAWIERQLEPVTELDDLNGRPAALR